MIHTVENSFMRLVFKQTMDDDMLHTLLLDIEVIINSRPQYDVALEHRPNTLLAPNHFFKIELSVGLPL